MSTLPEVPPLQVWRGALLLADFILQDLERWKDSTVVELGAGTGKLLLPLLSRCSTNSSLNPPPSIAAGLAGIAAARAARRVFITDRGEAILDNAVRNVVCNSHHAYSTTPLVRHLDWNESWPPAIAAHPVHGWGEEEVREASEANVVLAADVVYSEEITDAFFGMLSHLMPAGSCAVTIQKQRASW